MDHDVSALGRTKTRLSHAKMDGHKGDIYYYEMVEDHIASLQSRLDAATKALRDIASRCWAP